MPSSEGLERLLPVINQLQDVFSKVSMVHELDLPQIVVVGAQSTGKSSVLENIVGKDFLPRGSGIVTRRPLVLQMTHMSDEEYRRKREAGEPLETATFLHKPGHLFTNFQDVKKEIELETEAKCGARKGVSSEPIRLNITSNHVLDLTLIDLPGLTKIAVEGQQSTVGRDIEEMALDWIKPKNTIILAVTAANTDIANSDALQLARRVDPHGDRTIGVLTKLDLMDHGTNCVDVLTGSIVKLKKGFVGLVNRSQRDIDNNKNIAAALQSEQEYFRNHPAYGKLAKQLGTAHLTRTLSHNLLLHIKDCLPQLRQNILKLLEQTDALLKEYGDDETDMGPRSTLLTLIGSYAKFITHQLDGTMTDQDDKLGKTRGARINAVCNYGFVPHLEKMNPLEDITNAQIQTVISSCSGTRNKLFIPEQAFENLVKKCIKRLEAPSHKCVDHVHEEFVKLVEDAGGCLARYPALRQRVSEFMKEMLLELREPLNTFIKNLILMEMAQLNTNHPDFYDGGSIDQLIRTWTESRGDMVGESAQQAPPQSFHQQVDFTPPVNQKMQRETEIMRQLVTTYFSIVKRHMQDHVPKSIMHFMVDKLKESCNNRLVENFYKDELLDTLLEESEDITRRRRAAREMQGCLREAVDTLNKIREFRV